MTARTLTRRTFVRVGAAFTFLPSRVLGRGGALAPSEKLNLAFLGVGFKSRSPAPVFLA